MESSTRARITQDGQYGDHQLDKAVLEVLTNRDELKAAHNDFMSDTDILMVAEDAMANEKAQKYAYQHVQYSNVGSSKSQQSPEAIGQLQSPTLSRRDASREIRQPGAYFGGVNELETGETETSNASTRFNAGLVEARAVTGEPTIGILQEAREVDMSRAAIRTSDKKTKEKLCHLAVYCVCFLSLVVLVINLEPVFSTRKSNSTITSPYVPDSIEPTTAPSPAPTGYLDQLFDDLPLYTQKSLQNASTPQWAAWQWLSVHPNKTRLPNWKKKQLFVMATLYYALDGDNWPKEIKGDWMDVKVDECYWFSSRYGTFQSPGKYQVSIQKSCREPCDENGRIQTLALADLQLTDLTPSVPQEISLLTSLYYFGLPLNNISAPISYMLPPELLRLKNLSHLNFAVNNLTDLLPSELVLMTNMEGLRANRNHFSGPLPSEVGSMTSMKELALHVNFFSGLLPTEIGKMTNLTGLSIDNNAFMGTLPSELGLLTTLTSLSLSSNLFYGSLPLELGRMINLNHVDFAVNSFNGIFPKQMFSMTSLTHLSLARNAFSGFLPSEMVSLTSLGLLALAQNQLTGSLPSEFGMMTSLEALLLHENLLSGSIISEIGELTSLVELSMAGNSFTGQIPSEVGQLTKLVSLDLSSLASLTGSLPSEISRLTMLGYLNFSGSVGLSGSIPDSLCYLQDESCTFVNLFEVTVNCALDFTCTGSLCGCGCSCLNGMESKGFGIETEGLAYP